MIARLLVELKRGAYFAYDNLEVADTSEGWRDEADDKANAAALKISDMLKAGSYDTHHGLLTYIATTIKTFKNTAIAASEGAKRFDPLVSLRKSEDGETMEVYGFEPPAKEPPSHFLDSAKLSLLRTLPPGDQDLLAQFRQMGFDRAATAEACDMPIDTLNHQVARVTERIQKRKLLFAAFQVDLEHSHDLAERFDDLITYMHGLKKNQLPKTFKEAGALAQKDLPAYSGTVHTSTEQAVRHLLRLWRKHTPQ